MSQWIKSKVVMLPTEKATENGIIKLSGGDLIIAKRRNLGNKIFDAGVSSSVYIGSYEPQHLYFLSNEKIERGDLCMITDKTDANYGYIVNITVESNIEIYSKIISSTDKFLNLPHPSESFVKKYVEEYNKDNQIDYVMIEYTTDQAGFEYDKTCNKSKIIVKVDKCNQIIVRKLKDSWNRDEVISLLRSCLEATGIEIRAEMKNIPISPYIEFSGEDFDEWVEKNV